MSSFLTYNNSYINEIISSKFPIKSLRTEDAIIAGGFPLAVFLKVEATKEEFLPFAVRKITTEGHKRLQSNELSYTDIDIWVKSGSANTILNNLLDINTSPHLSLDDSILSCTRKSRWANTYSVISKNGNSYIKDIQIIKNRHEDAKSLLSTFDLNICKVAWCNGELILDKDVIKEITSGEFGLDQSYDFGEQNFTTRLYRSLRFIKYAKRYSLEPSPQICEYIYHTIADSSDENIKYSLENQTGLVNISKYTNHSDKTQSMYHSLVCNSTYEWFSRCKNFKKEWSLFLINHPIITVIQQIIDGNKESNFSTDIPF